MALDTTDGLRHVTCGKCGRHGPTDPRATIARRLAHAAGWARGYPRGRGEDFRCPDCRAVPVGTSPHDRRTP